MPRKPVLTIQGPGANFLTVQRSAAFGTPNFRPLSFADLKGGRDVQAVVH